VAANILAQNHHLPGAAKCGGVDGAGLMVQVLMRGDLVEGSPNRTRRMGPSYVYLGYWVEGSRKMAYKGRFLPQQRLAPDGWKRVEY
jgi:Arginine-tRNA-protein transferase, C terminus